MRAAGSAAGRWSGQLLLSAGFQARQQFQAVGRRHPWQSPLKCSKGGCHDIACDPSLHGSKPLCKWAAHVPGNPSPPWLCCWFGCSMLLSMLLLPPPCKFSSSLFRVCAGLPALLLLLGVGPCRGTSCDCKKGRMIQHFADTNPACKSHLTSSSCWAPLRVETITYQI